MPRQERNRDASYSTLVVSAEMPEGGCRHDLATAYTSTPPNRLTRG